MSSSLPAVVGPAKEASVACRLQAAATWKSKLSLQPVLLMLLQHGEAQRRVCLDNRARLRRP